MLQKPERALRREIARLAAFDPDDLAAVLDELDPHHRLRVEALLRELLTPTVSGPGSGFAPWVDARLAGGGEMTEEARRLLARCAARLAPAPSRPSPSLFERALGSGAR